MGRDLQLRRLGDKLHILKDYDMNNGPRMYIKMWLNMVDSFVRQNNSNAKNTCNEM